MATHRQLIRAAAPTAETAAANQLIDCAPDPTHHGAESKAKSSTTRSPTARPFTQQDDVPAGPRRKPSVSSRASAPSLANRAQ